MRKTTAPGSPPMPEQKQWLAVATHRTARGPKPIRYEFEELADLGDLIERGPDWDTIEKIVVTKLRNPRPGYTIEQSERE